MGRLIAKILAWLAILLGLALLIQPTAAQWWTSTRNAKTAAQFAARAEAQPTAPAAEETTAEPPEPERAYPELYAAMQDYNAEIYAGGQSGLTDPFAYEEAPLDLAAYGYDDDVLAVLWIPRLNLELPVYLGASRENLAKGAALLGQTSMPLGGENTNTVIAAHRGRLPISALVVLVLLRLDAAYLRRQVTAELLVPDKPVIQGEDFTLTVRLRNRSRLPIPALVVLLNAADEWGGGQLTLRCAAMLGGKESAEQRITLNAGKSGVWSIAVRGITLRDHLGVFTAACPAAVQSQSICVLPAAAAGKAKAETAPDEDGDEADPSVLDRMEASYAAYAASRYTAVPDGYDELQTLCDEAKKDQKLTEAADIGDYIRAYLNTNYQYNASAPQPPEGADPIRYFLTESKQGYSVQFASAAVVMFRMFGLPARYVVGYAAPQSLFTQQEDGSWHAILQDDNAHAWAEVYISGQGWTPMEMTPGVLVSAQQADLRTDPLPETQGQDTAPAAGESSANEPAATIVPRSRLVLAALLGGCLLAAAVLLVLARRHAMGYGRGSCNARVLAVFGSIYRLLVRRGLPPDTPSDAPEFAAFLQSCVPALEPQDAEALLALAQAAQFGAGTMTEQDTDKMRKLYHVIKHTGKRKQSQE